MPTFYGEMRNAAKEVGSAGDKDSTAYRAAAGRGRGRRCKNSSRHSNGTREAGFLMLVMRARLLSYLRLKIPWATVNWAPNKKEEQWRGRI